MAAAMNCEELEGVGCGVCSSCRRIARGVHPDVHRIAPEGPIIPVDVVRETILPEAARSPFEGRRKIFIVEEAERMNASAQNALLKTLEEPQPDTIFVLISDQEDEVLETIRSRCRIVRLERVPERRIVELLVAEGAPPEQALLAARLSECDLERARPLALDTATMERRALWTSIPRRLASPVDALDAAADVVSEAREAVKRLDQVHKKEVEELVEATGDGRGSAVARNVLSKRHKRELRRLEERVVGEALQSLGSFYRDVLVARRGDGEVLTNIDIKAEVEAWAASDASDAALLSAVERCITARASLARNANTPLAIEAALLELGRLVPPAGGPPVARAS
jgi:DNA polymerase-3 subunit delta'